MVSAFVQNDVRELCMFNFDLSSEKERTAHTPLMLHPSAVSGKRPGSLVMSPELMLAAYPNALSFSRMAMAEFARHHWRVTRLRLDLDAAGEGEALYCVSDGKWQFHFIVFSRQLLPEQQVDRNFAVSWDVTAALCQGEWTPQREEHLRQEIPKQLTGWVDCETLMLTRGNRSGRLFDHVVESLASGLQPDARRLGEIGYVLRTTGFIGNGVAGTRAYSGFGPEHPLRAPYHAQIWSAFLLREFVFDLVEHMALARSPSAVRLKPAYKRFLGLGNSAATGLVRFMANRPKLVHQWCSTWEAAFATALAREPSAREIAKLVRLMDRAATYFRQEGSPARGIFSEASRLDREISQLRQIVEDGAIAAETRGGTMLAALSQWAERNCSYETREILNAIILEIFPDIVVHFSQFFRADEEADIIPDMTVGELKSILQNSYRWAFEWDLSDSGNERFFWFHSVQAPEDARRGFRYVQPHVEHENTLETVRQVQGLALDLEARSDADIAANIAASNPEFWHIITRIQALADCEYAEMRDNPLSESFSPYPAIRKILAFFGMEKFESAPPKVVRGALLQGAPTVEDLASGTDGDWPFPLLPVS